MKTLISRFFALLLCATAILATADTSPAAAVRAATPRAGPCGGSRLRYLDDPESDYPNVALSLARNAAFVGDRWWSGLNPFWQPSLRADHFSTDYYGSGDIDLDGWIRLSDILAVQDMVNGVGSPNYRADVDLDGAVTAEDLTLVNDACNDGERFLNRWHEMTRADRLDMVEKMLALDPTSAIPYDADRWVCHNYAVELSTNNVDWRNELEMTIYDGGAYRFNIPIYAVGVSAPDLGHGVNAVLVGDDWREFDDWVFIDPQNDSYIEPGDPNMPFGSDLYIRSVQNVLYHGVWQYYPIVHFRVDEGDSELRDYDANLLANPPAVPATVRNSKAVWNPTLIPRSDSLLVESPRDDLTHQTDLHLWHDGVATALTLSDSASRILDVAIGEDGAVHNLWKTKVGNAPTVMHGQLDLEGGALLDVSAVSGGYRNPAAGRVVVVDGQPHAFWLETRSHAADPLPGVYHASKAGGVWSAAELLISSDVEWLHEDHDWEKHNTLRYMFDVARIGGRIVLAAAWRGTSEDESVLQYCVFDGAWSAVSILESGNIRGLDLENDSQGRVHMVYWRGAFSQRRGDLYSRVYDSGVWSEPVAIDDGGNVGYPSAAPWETGVVVAYERDVGDQIVPVLAVRSRGAWRQWAQIEVPDGSDAWYPSVTASDRTAAVVWSERSPDKVVVGSTSMSLRRVFVPLLSNSAEASSTERWCSPVDTRRREFGMEPSRRT